jgi:hypothetical protein
MVVPMKLAKATERIDPCLEGEAVVDTGGNHTGLRAKG